MNSEQSPPPPRSARQRSLTATAIVVVGGRVYGMAVSLAAMAVVARVLSQQEFGAFAFALSLLYVSAALGRFGFDRLVLKVTAERVANDHPGGARATQGAIYLCVLITSSMVSLALLAYALFLPGSLPMGVWLTLIVGAPTMSLTQVGAEHLRGLGDAVRATLFDTMRTGPIVNSLFLTAVVSAYLLRGELDVAFVLALFVASHVLLFLLTVSRLRRVEHFAGSYGDSLRVTAPELLRKAAPIAGSDLIAVVTTSIDIWIVTYVLTHREVAQIAVVSQFSQIVASPLTMASAAVSHGIAALAARGDLKQLQHVLRSAATLATAVSLCVYLPIVLFGSELLAAVYGPAYAELSGLLTIHCGARLVFTATGVAGLLLVLTSRQRMLFVVNAAFLVGHILLAGCSTYYWGLAGLVVAGSMLVVAQNVLVCCLARRSLSIWTHTYFPTSLKSWLQRNQHSLNATG